MKTYRIEMNVDGFSDKYEFFAEILTRTAAENLARSYLSGPPITGKTNWRVIENPTNAGPNELPRGPVTWSGKTS